MKKALINDLGHVVGCIDVPRGAYSSVEYGDYDKDGILHVQGIAKLENMSNLTLQQKEQAQRREWNKKSLSDES